MTDEEIRLEVAKMVTQIFCSANGRGSMNYMGFDTNSKILFDYIKFGHQFPESPAAGEKES